MRSFREVAYNFQKPIADLSANAVTAGLGTMNPIVDLQAQKEITKTDLDQLEKYADRLFGAVGIDVEFTRHFLDRVNDERNKKQIDMWVDDCVHIAVVEAMVLQELMKEECIKQAVLEEATS